MYLRGGITSGLTWSEHATGRTSEEEPRATITIAVFREKRNNRLKCPESAGELQQVERNHPLECRRPGSTQRGIPLSVETKGITITDIYFFLHSLCISERAYHTRTRKSRAIFLRNMQKPLTIQCHTCYTLTTTFTTE